MLARAAGGRGEAESRKLEETRAGFRHRHTRTRTHTHSLSRTDPQLHTGTHTQTRDHRHSDPNHGCTEPCLDPDAASDIPREWGRPVCETSPGRTQAAQAGNGTRWGRLTRATGVLGPRTQRASEGERGAAVGWAVGQGKVGRLLWRGWEGRNPCLSVCHLSAGWVFCSGLLPLPFLLSEFSVFFHFVYIFCFSPALSFSPLSLRPLCPGLSRSPSPHKPLSRVHSEPPGTCFLGFTDCSSVGSLPFRDLVLISVLAPCTSLRIASRGLGDFSQGQIQGCCGSGQLLPEPPCPPPSPGDRKACQGLALSWRLPSPPSRAGGVVGVPVSLGGSPQLLWSLMSSITLCLSHWGHRDSSNQLLSVYLALPCALGSSFHRAQQTPAPSPPARPALGWGRGASTVVSHLKGELPPPTAFTSQRRVRPGKQEELPWETWASALSCA